MAWIALIILAVLFFQHLPEWLAFIVTLFMFFAQIGTQRQTKDTVKKPPSASSSNNTAPAYQLLIGFALMRQTLKQRHDENAVGDLDYQQLIAELDELEQDTLEQFWLPAHVRHEQLTQVWQKLTEMTGESSDIPDWLIPEPSPEATVTRETAAPSTPPRSTTTPVETREATTEPVKPTSKSLAAKPHPQPRPTPPPPPPREKKPNVLLDTWQKLIFPFFWQNFLWFISGFLTLSGSTFLIVSTEGYSRAMAVLISLALYAALLAGGGYLIRQRKPNLVTPGNMLLTAGLLLTPLIIAAAVWLIRSASQGWEVALGWLLGAGVIVGAFFGAKLAFGLIHPPLQTRHTVFFIALSGLQFAAPFVQHWAILSALHLGLLLLLAVSAWQFCHHWLTSIFENREHTTLYAISTLVFAAFVSFINLTLANRELTLPDGYPGMFLIALCGVLCYVDVQLRAWAHVQPLLSRFSFAVYALSAIAVVLSLDPAGRFEPISPLTATLLIATGLYGYMVRQYLSLPPLYLLLLSATGVYALLVLHPLPQEWHFIFSLPGLWGIYRLHVMGRKRENIDFAVVCYRAMLLIAAVVMATTLLQSGPGWPALASVLVALILHVWNSRRPTDDPYLGLPGWWAQHREYGVTGLSVLALAYAPLLPQASWLLQFSVGTIVLTAVWVVLAQHVRTITACSVYLHSALLTGGLSVLAAIFYFDNSGQVPGFASHLLALASISLWLSLRWLNQIFFYITLLFSGIASGLLIFHYWPDVPGLPALLAMILFWLGGWWLARYSEQVPNADSESGKSSLPQDVALALFGVIPVSPSAFSSVTVMIREPLVRAMYILWLLGIVQLMFEFLAGHITSLWALTATVGAASSLLLAGNARSMPLLSVSLALAVAGPLAQASLSLSLHWLPVVLLASVLILWSVGLAVLSHHHPVTKLTGWEGGYPPPGGRQYAEETLHWTLFLMSLGGVLAEFLPVLTETDAVPFLPPLLFTLLMQAAFMYWAGQRYSSVGHAYLTVASLAASSFVLYDWALHIPVGLLLHPMQITPLLTGLAALFTCLAWWRADNAETLYDAPLNHFAIIFYLWALGAAVLLWLAGDAVSLNWLPSIFVALALILWPLAYNSNGAAETRGLGMSLLLTLAISATLPMWGTLPDAIYLWFSWAVVLWAVDYFALPRLNRHWPAWAIETRFATGIGLVIILAATANAAILNHTLHWLHLLLAAGYLLLAMQSVYWHGLRWLCALLLFVGGGDALYDWLSPHNDYLLSAALALWANALMHLTTMKQDVGQVLKRLRDPLFAWPYLALCILLAGLGLTAIGGLVMAAGFAETPVTPADPLLSFVAALTALSFAHAYYLRKSPRFSTHAFILALFTAFLGITVGHVTLPALLTFWFVLLTIAHIGLIRYRQQAMLLPVVTLWQSGALLLALVALLLTFPEPPNSQLMINLGVLAIFAGLTGLSVQSIPSAERWLNIAIALTLIWLHLAWVVWSPALPLPMLVTIYSLQTAMLAWVVFEWRRSYELTGALQRIAQWLPQFLANLSVVLWLWHAALVAQTPPFALEITQGIALLAGLLLATLWWRHGPQNDEAHVYGLLITLALLGAYLRVALLGYALPTVWDTAALMAGGGLVMWLARRYPHLEALYRLSLFAPGPALLSVPWQPGSTSTSIVLLASAVLYLWTPRESSQQLPRWLALVAINAAVYLWVPIWVQESQVLWVYTIPAATTVLLMLELHWLELPRDVAHIVRIIALATLYGSATLDVFTQPGFGIFLLTIGLSLAGVMLGIALRVRAFLYTGAIFLVLNVSSRLITLSPENQFSQAIVLMTLGALIAGGMIWISLQRDALLQRIRLMREDLAAWE